MMVLQVILIICFIVMGVNFMKSRHTSRTKAYKKLFLLLSLPLAIAFVLFPETANKIANIVGIGRGADLLIYGLAVVVLFQLFNNYIKEREQERRFVKLARKVAMLEAGVRKIDTDKDR